MSNPYNAPSADMSLPGETGDTYEPRVFAFNGRIGRLRYLAYGLGLTFLGSTVLGLALLALVKSGPRNPYLLTAVFYLPLIALSMVILARRLNDIGKTGWLSLLLLIPMVNLVGGVCLLFWPGDKGRNAFGPAPCANSGMVIAGVWILPAIFIFGVLAGVAVPAFKAYDERVKARQAAPAVSPEAQR